ncbi:hypothetical protein CBM2588_A40051 [Cupriavidus taiwanensis]|nr:hypothetical protein CBM2588_A40051 [Cupriavidus taiwanensis]
MPNSFASFVIGVAHTFSCNSLRFIVGLYG